VSLMSGGKSSSSALSAFPLVVSGNQRYLQGQTGVPFPILGRTALVHHVAHGCGEVKTALIRRPKA
jgi:hypothetical protein